ncbi:hypothetical protein [Nostoc edaphicum]|uniref:Transmembrane protein n=1 Tax=Nostoc edaphicum CCNP1411 TaxID=1472755 RepID=A0A7D7L935_9NOSO|nr:hypothetical protein [Nostoc edaphicum]QMS87276.1 hypothetical protein HUN01_06635 [Nostoc edaphicum CCNP1411]
MHSLNIFCHESVVAVSFVACIIGLVLLWDSKQKTNEMEETERILFRMSFSYWLVYCVAFGIEKMVLPDWESVLMTLKITTALSYFLTFSCILSLPLHKFAVHRVEE